MPKKELGEGSRNIRSFLINHAGTTVEFDRILEASGVTRAYAMLYLDRFMACELVRTKVGKNQFTYSVNIKPRITEKDFLHPNRPRPERSRSSGRSDYLSRVRPKRTQG